MSEENKDRVGDSIENAMDELNLPDKFKANVKFLISHRKELIAENAELDQQRRNALSSGTTLDDRLAYLFRCEIAKYFNVRDLVQELGMKQRPDIPFDNAELGELFDEYIITGVYQKITEFVENYPQCKCEMGSDNCE